MNRYRAEFYEQKVDKLSKEWVKFDRRLDSLKVSMADIKTWVEDKITELSSVSEEWQLDDESECHIYFIRSQDFVKIGYSKNPVLRMSGLQTANPNKLELLYSFPSFQWREKEIHKDLKKHFINGEWFSYNDEVKRYIEKIEKENLRPKKGV